MIQAEKGRDGTLTPVRFGFDGQSDAVKRLRERLEAALTDFGLHMLTGEPGSGRTRAARYLWMSSGREKRLVSVFDRQSFDEALREEATSCLLIDEIGLAEPAFQAALLEMLQARKASERPAVICTSSWTSARLVQDRRLSEGLGSLLAPHNLPIPPARDRQADLKTLCALWERQFETGTSLHDDCASWLMKQEWPGNFRQIRQLLHCAVERAQGGRLTAAHLSESHRVDTTADAASFQGLLARYLPSMLDLETDIQGTLYARVLAEVERPLFRLVLKATEGNQIRAAALLGINRNTLRKRLQLLGIEVGRSRS